MCNTNSLGEKIRNLQELSLNPESWKRKLLRYNLRFQSHSKKGQSKWNYLLLFGVSLT